MTHYKGKIQYYIVENEPDVEFGQGLLTAQQCYEFTQVAYQAAREIDPAIRIESPPTNSPESDLLRQMIQLGIGNYCDYIGTHVYGSQIMDGRLDKPWQWLDQYGTTRKPIAASECGVNPNWDPPKIGGQEWRRRWQPQWYLALKRYGYTSGMLFSLTPDEDPWQYYNDQFQTVHQPLEDEIKRFNNNPLANGSFESANDKEREWVVYYNPDAAAPLANNIFVTNDPGSAHGGTGYLKMEVGLTPAGQPITVRRIAGRLQPGTTYTFGAWAYVKGGTTARLTASGYNPLRGNEEKTAASTVQNAWQYLSVTVTPAHYWTVIQLNTSGTGTSGDFVKWDDVAVSSGTTPPVAPAFSGYYKLTARHSGKALDVNGGPSATANGTQVIQYDYFGNDNQKWRFEQLSDGYYKITAKHSGKALDVSDISTANGARIHQWDYVGGANQQWKVESVGDGYYKLTAKHSGKALDVSDISTANLAPVHQWEYLGGTNQQWKIEFVQSAARVASAQTSSGEAEPGLRLYPNPAGNQVTLTCYAPHAQEAKVVFTDLLARPLSAQAVRLAQGYNQVKLGVGTLPKGLYLVTLQMHGEKQTAKLVVEK
jgi:hypothetical protein